jgi:5-methylthioadenosine/S-adenosylhomocysteine deaminase
MEKLDLLVSAKFVLPLEDENVLIDAGVGIKGDTIIAVGEIPRLLDRFSPQKHLHYEHGLIMPGLINAHTHIPMTLFRGLADDLPLMIWLTKYIFPLEKQLKPEWVYWGSLLGCAELIMSGTTCFCDMYLFADEVARAADRAGLRAVVGEVLYDFPSPNYGPIEKGFVYTENLIKKWLGNPLVSIAVEPHAVYTCSPSLLKQAKEISEKHAIPYVIHLAETKAEIGTTKEKFNRTPPQHLAKLGILDETVIAVHCVWLTESDVDLLEKYQVKVVHNPESNLKLASGIAPIPSLLSQGITVGLGTDGPASNNDLDMFLEMDTAAKVHKLKQANPTLMSAWQVLAMATKEGAKTLGMGEKIGTITPGKRADLIVVDFNQPHLIPVYNPGSHLVYAASGKDVLTTIINGKVVMENRKVLTLDLEEIYDHIKVITREFVIK